MKPKILLVEDEEHLQKTIRLNLELEGYSVTSASDGIEALKNFRKDTFQLLIPWM
jgi:two-component system, OmpR family, alkaline phosphatase synthesis response regulator PhoP